MGLSEVQAQRLLGYLRQYERGLRGAHSRGRGSTAELLNRLRYARRKRREKQKTISIARVRNISPTFLLRTYSDNALLSGLFQGRHEKWRPAIHRLPSSEVELKGFSFLDSPHETMNSLGRIVAAECSYANAELHFRNPYCQDIGVFLVLEAMWREMAPIFTGGQISPPVSRVLEAVALRKSLGWRAMPADWDPKDIVPFPFRRQERPKGSERSEGIEPTRSAIITTDWVNFIDRTLNQACGAELTDAGKTGFGLMIGELLDNAETHGAADQRGNYTIAGFVARRVVDGTERFRFHLGFLSPGQTISEGLADPPAAIRPAIDSYLQKHKANSLSEETLRTVFAFQDGVSRLAEKYYVSDGRSLGGTGLADILQFNKVLTLLAEDHEEPRLVIVSGSTYILIKEPYRTAVRRSNDVEHGARQIWFNSNNSRNFPPDPAHVTTLPGHLQGTLVTMAFNINPHLMRARDE